MVDHSDHGEEDQTFFNSCLRRILGLWWPKIANNEQHTHVRCQWDRRADRDDGDGLVIISTSQSIALQDRP